MNDWTLMKVWNESLGKKEERLPEPRERLFASELGRSDIDLFLKLKGEKPSNEPDDRAYRKFNAGDLYEWFVSLVLLKCGIYITTQTAVKLKLKDMLEVSGRLDFIAGGVPRYEEASEEISKLVTYLNMPPIFSFLSEKLIAYFKENYPDGLKEKVLEIKSVAVHGFNRIEATGKALGGHDLQAFHYAHTLGKEGAICYISRDDLRMFEIPILPNDQNLLDRYKAKVKKMTDFYNSNVMPNKEPLVLFDEDTLRFSTNFNVQYSSFLTMLYGFQHPEQYKNEIGKPVMRWNTAMARHSLGKKMTPKNLESIEEIRKAGFDVDLIMKTIETKKPILEDEDLIILTEEI